MARLLLIEDNEDLAFGISRSLEDAGHTVEVAIDGPSGVEKALAMQPELIVLDLMLPGLSGFEVLQSIRAGGLQVPVIILTARGEETDKLHGFRLGADDYVTKPFSVSEVLARVNVHLRRHHGGAADDHLVHRFGNVVVTPSEHIVTRDGQRVTLKPREFDLLLKFLERPRFVFTRDRLLAEVWKYGAEVHTRTVDLHVGELRRKLEIDPAEPRHFVTVWKSGYRFEP
ncbi:MAG TPA: response regulator transcription factor [Gemmatimonas sp.]|nr:response regulator transcription factor [Gemmatimonas sp.]